MKGAVRNPFLRWAGCKRQALDVILPRINRPCRRYVEPCVGTGVVYTNSMHRSALLADADPFLINMHTQIRDHAEAVVSACHRLWRLYFHNSEAVFYHLLDWLNDPSTDPVMRAALYIWINNRCYNGIMRSADGRVSPSYCERHRELNRRHLYAASIFYHADRLRGCEIVCQDVWATLAQCGVGDLVYIDPPYLGPDSAPWRDAIGYVRGSFESREDHARLLIEMERAAARGAIVFCSNADTSVARELYGSNVVVAHEREMTMNRLYADGDEVPTLKEMLAMFVPGRKHVVRMLRHRGAWGPVYWSGSLL